MLFGAAGEIMFVWDGVLLQCLSIACEALRLTMIQILMQKSGLKLNPINTMLYVSPTCLAYLAGASPYAHR